MDILSMVARAYQQINFSTLNRFCQLSKTLPNLQFLMDIIMLDGISRKIKWKCTPLLLHCISSFEGTSLNIFYNTVIMILSSYCFTSADAIFHNFLEIHLKLSETILWWMFLLFMDSLTPSTPPPHPPPPKHTHSSLSL